MSLYNQQHRECEALLRSKESVYLSSIWSRNIIIDSVNETIATSIRLKSRSAKELWVTSLCGLLVVMYIVFSYYSNLEYIAPNDLLVKSVYFGFGVFCACFCFWCNYEYLRISRCAQEVIVDSYTQLHTLALIEDEAFERRSLLKQYGSSCDTQDDGWALVIN